MKNLNKWASQGVLSFSLLLGISAVVSAQVPPQQVERIVVRPSPTDKISGKTLGDILPEAPYDYGVVQAMEPIEISIKKDKTPWEWQQYFKTKAIFCYETAKTCDAWSGKAKGLCVGKEVAEFGTNQSHCIIAVDDEHGTGSCAGIKAANSC